MCSTMEFEKNYYSVSDNDDDTCSTSSMDDDSPNDALLKSLYIRWKSCTNEIEQDLKNSGLDMNHFKNWINKKKQIQKKSRKSEDVTSNCSWTELMNHTKTCEQSQDVIKRERSKLGDMILERIRVLFTCLKKLGYTGYTIAHYEGVTKVAGTIEHYPPEIVEHLRSEIISDDIMSSPTEQDTSSDFDKSEQNLCLYEELCQAIGKPHPPIRPPLPRVAVISDDALPLPTKPKDSEIAHLSSSFSKELSQSIRKPCPPLRPPLPVGLSLSSKKVPVEPRMLKSSTLPSNRKALIRESERNMPSHRKNIPSGLNPPGSAVLSDSRSPPHRPPRPKSYSSNRLSTQ